MSKPSVATATETKKITVDGEDYEIQMLTDFELLGLYGLGTRSSAEVYRDTILASVINPTLTKAEVTSMRGGKMVRLGNAILSNYMDVLASFRESLTMPSE